MSFCTAEVNKVHECPLWLCL